MPQEKSSDISSQIIILIMSSLFIWGIISGMTSWFGGEREGVVKYSDCRETITLKSDTFQRYYKKFTCEYTKTQSGKIMSGSCIHVDISGGLFSRECKRAYVYDKKPETQCSQEYPYLGYDDKCYKVWDYGRVNAVNNQIN